MCLWCTLVIFSPDTFSLFDCNPLLLCSYGVTKIFKHCNMKCKCDILLLLKIHRRLIVWLFPKFFSPIATVQHKGTRSSFSLAFFNFLLCIGFASWHAILRVMKSQDLSWLVSSHPWGSRKTGNTLIYKRKHWWSTSLYN